MPDPSNSLYSIQRSHAYKLAMPMLMLIINAMLHNHNKNINPIPHRSKCSSESQHLIPLQPALPLSH